MPFNYELDNYRLHSITTIKFSDTGEVGYETRDLAEGLAIEKRTSASSDKPSYVVIAFLRPSEDAAGCIDIEFVTERITEIKGDEWRTFMKLYYRAHRALLNKESIYYKKPTPDFIVEEELIDDKKKREINEFTNTIFHTQCLVCGEEISYPATDWYNSDSHASPYIKICKHCKDAILKARADMDWEEEVGQW